MVKNINIVKQEIMTEAQKISISIQDEIYKQVDEILNKLNICFLDLNDFGDLYHADGTKRIFKFELFEKENGYYWPKK